MIYYYINIENFNLDKKKILITFFLNVFKGKNNKFYVISNFSDFWLGIIRPDPFH